MSAPRAVRRAAIAESASREKSPPTSTLFCGFYNFKHNATVESFLFAVERASTDDPRFLEVAIVEPDGTGTACEAEQRLPWTRATDDGVAMIAA